MDHCLAKLVLYGDLPRDSILMQLGEICHDAREQKQENDVLIARCYTQVRRLLEVATSYGFDENLWQNYLTYVLITEENPFTLTAEKTGARKGSVNAFAKQDYAVFQELFHYDFSWLEKRLDIDCFSRLLAYTAISKPEQLYNRNISEKVRPLSKTLAQAANPDAFFSVITSFYHDYGVGIFGLHKAFRIQHEADRELTFLPINNLQQVWLDDLIGYASQKETLLENTRAFVAGRPANNCLLFGDSGTGKSTCIKAIVNELYPQGLRLIEIYKHQFRDLSAVISAIKKRNYRFIIYMDDLSFEDFEIEYKYLKAVIEGGMEMKPENVLIYATSNRRHLIKKNWADRADMEIEEGLHRSDTMEEKLSLVYRFGITIGFSKPDRKEYHAIVKGLAERAGVTLPEAELLAGADRWEIRHGGISGRTAQHYITNLLSGNPSPVGEEEESKYE